MNTLYEDVKDGDTDMYFLFISEVTLLVHLVFHGRYFDNTNSHKT